MTIILPRLPRASDYEVRLVEGTDVQRSTNGVALPLARTGDHFEVEIDTGSLSPIHARELTVDLHRARGERVRVLLPQQGIDTGPLGVVTVDGAGQSGTTLNVRTPTPHGVFRKGWYVTVITDGIGRLCELAAEAVANADGEAALSIWPMLRVPPADGDTVEVAEPFLEGLRDKGGDLVSGLVRAARPGAFVIEETD